MIDYTGTYTDQYELSMAQVYFKKNTSNEKAVFDYFFRKLPFGGGYAVFAGLEDLLTVIEELVFDEKDISFLKKTGFSSNFLDYLEAFRFTGSIYSCREGELVFPTMPVVTVEANMLEAQILETLILNILNIQTLVATKASRMKLVAEKGELVDFGLRRAHGPGGYYASRAAIVGGFDATSNVRAGRDYNIPVSGTMAHSFVQSYDEELTAFRDFAEAYPENCVLLIDTYDTLKSGLPNAIKVGEEMRERGEHLLGIRLDSGDLAYLSKESRKRLDAAGLKEVKIAASNQLDEHVIKSLNEQNAPIDLFGVGTSLVTGQPDAALDGVYKLAYANGKPRIKLSESISKTTLPHRKQVYRLTDEEGQWIGADVISLADERSSERMHHPFEPEKNMVIKELKKEPLLHPVMEHGTRCTPPKTLKEIAAYGRQRIEKLPDEHKRFTNPHVYKIGISEGLKNKRDQLIESHKS